MHLKQKILLKTPLMREHFPKEKWRRNAGAKYAVSMGWEATAQPGDHVAQPKYGRHSLGSLVNQVGATNLSNFVLISYYVSVTRLLNSRSTYRFHLSLGLLCLNLDRHATLHYFDSYVYRRSDFWPSVVSAGLKCLFPLILMPLLNVLLNASCRVYIWLAGSAASRCSLLYH